MAMTTEECIARLECALCMAENSEAWILENSCDDEELREVEKDIETYRRAIAAMNRMEGE